MLNTNYAPEIASAYKFVQEHKDDVVLMGFLKDLEVPFYTHSDRWALIYDFILKRYPEAAGGPIVTGLAYYVEK